MHTICDLRRKPTQVAPRVTFESPAEQGQIAIEEHRLSVHLHMQATGFPDHQQRMVRVGIRRSSRNRYLGGILEGSASAAGG